MLQQIIKSMLTPLTLEDKRLRDAERQRMLQEKEIALKRTKKATKVTSKFIKDWLELMAQLGIHNQIDKCPSPNFLKLIEKEGAFGVSGKLAFPVGTNYGQLEKEEVTKSIQQAMMGGCMFRLLGEKDKSLVDFVAINKWHNIPYSPVPTTNFGDVFLGYDIMGEPVIFNLNKCPHPCIFGGTGSGKSILVELMITNMALTHSPEECHFYFCQISKTDFVKFKKLAHTRALLIPDASESEEDSLREILNMFKYIQQEICHRQELMKDMLENGEDGNIVSYNKANPKNKLPLIVIWTDESSDLFSSEGSKNKEIKDLRDEIREYAERLSKTARSFGIFIVNCLQKSTKSQFSTLMKNQSIAKISFTQSTVSESQNAIDSTDAYGLPRYVCALRRFDGSGSDVQYFKTGYAPNWIDIRKLLEKKGVFYDHPLMSFKATNIVETPVNLMVEPPKRSIKTKGDTVREHSESEIYKKQIEALKNKIEELEKNQAPPPPYVSQISNYKPYETSLEGVEEIIDETEEIVFSKPKIR